MATKKLVRNRARWQKRKANKMRFILIWSKNIATFLNKHNLNHSYHYPDIDYTYSSWT
jgi:hypothetical protein